MEDSGPPDVTRLLQAWSDGDESALEQLTPLVYAELHRLAKMYMAREWNQQTLETGALLNEAYMRLVDLKRVQWQNRAHFFAMSARLMRRILVDFARSRHYEKRGGGAVNTTVEALVPTLSSISADHRSQALSSMRSSGAGWT